MADSVVTAATSSITGSILKTLSTASSEESEALKRSQTGWSSPDSFLTKLFRGDPSMIGIALLTTVTLPVLLHLYFYTASARARSSGGGGDGIPLFLLLGPSASGKTSLVTLLQRRLLALSTEDPEEAKNKEERESRPKIQIHGTNGHATVASPTRLSQISTVIGMRLPPGTPLGSNKYRSENDYELQNAAKTATPYKLVDTPGHGKLRSEQALSWISKANTGLKGVILVLDSSAIESADSETAKDTVRYLHDVLLALQRRPKLVKRAKAGDVKVLIACNKQDLFTSLPPPAIRSRLQDELERLRTSRRKGVSAVDARDDQDEDEDETALGGGGEEKFSFKLFEDEFGISIDIIGGTVKGDASSDDEGKGVVKWEEWIGSCL